jgi:WD40 repeat protein
VLVTAHSGAPDGEQVRLWDLASQRSVCVLPHQSAEPAGADGTVRLFCIAERRETKRLVAGGPGIQAIAFSPDGTLVGVGGDDGVIHIFSVADGAEITRMGPQWRHPAVMGVGFFREGSRVAILTPDALSIRETERHTVLRSVSLGGEGRCLALSRDGRVAVGLHGGSVLIYAPNEDERSFCHLGCGEVCSVAFSGDNRELVAASCDGSVHLLDLEGKR